MSKFKFNKSSIEERSKTQNPNAFEKRARLLGLIEKGAALADRVADNAANREEKRLRTEAELLGAESILEERRHYREEGSRLSSRFGELLEAAINSNAASLLLQVGMERFVASSRRKEEIDNLHHQAIAETLRRDVEEVKEGRLKVWPWEVTRKEEAVEAVVAEEVKEEAVAEEAVPNEEPDSALPQADVGGTVEAIEAAVRAVEAEVEAGIGPQMMEAIKEEIKALKKLQGNVKALKAVKEEIKASALAGAREAVKAEGNEDEEVSYW